MTKADCLKEGDERFWLDCLEGNTKKEFVHGFFAVRLSATKERSNDWVTARKLEQDFFSKTRPRQDSPWMTVPDFRLGVKNLGKYLSKELSLMIEKS